MKSKLHRRCGRALASALILMVANAALATNTWNRGTAGNWNEAGNWLGGIPTLTDDALFASGGTTVTNGTSDTARSLTFTNTSFTLLGGNLWLDWGLIDVASTRTATINSLLAGRRGLVKSGGGTLTFGGTNLVTGGITISGGRVTLASTALGDIGLGNNAISLSGTGVLDIRRSRTVYMREFSGTGTITGTGYLDPAVFNVLGDATFSGTFTSGLDPWGTFNKPVKTGPGTQRIESALGIGDSPLNFWRGEFVLAGASGAISINRDNGQGAAFYGGTLVLDDSVGDINRFPDASTAAISVIGSGGTLRYIGLTGGNSSELVGTLKIGDSQDNRYGGTLRVDVRPGTGGNATLTFASYATPTSPEWPSSAFLVNFTSPGTLGSDAYVKFTSAPTLVNNVMYGGFANGTDIATYDATKGVIPFNPIGGGGVAYVGPAGATGSSTVYLNADHTLSANTAWNALKLDGTLTLDLNGKTLAIGNNSLELMVVKTGAGEAKIVNNGALQYLDNTTGRAEDYAFLVNQGSLKLEVPLAASNYLRVNKAGSGLLWLAPTANYAGTGTGYGSGIYFSDGAIRLDPDSGRFVNLPMILNGGVMEIEGGGTYNPTIGTGNANVFWKTSGGFAAFGGDATFAPNITWNAASHIPDGAALLLNSTTATNKITLSGKLNLGTDGTKMYLREIYVADNTNSITDSAEISGQIISDTTAGGGGTPTYTYHLVKTGAGTLSLSHDNNNYSGATYVKEGILAINGKLAAPANSTVAINPDYTAVHVMDGGTLGGTGTIDRVVRVESGGTLSPGNSTGILTLGADASLTNGATLKLEINGLTAGTEHDQLKLTAGDLVISNSTLSLSWGLFSVTGNTNYIWIVNNIGEDHNILGTFNGLTNDAVVAVTNGRTWQISYDANYSIGLKGGNDIALYAIIPEPSSWMLVGFGLVGAWMLRRRVRR